MSTPTTHTLADLDSGRWHTDTAPASDGSRGTAAAIEQITGWSLRPEGLCRDDLCVPVTDRPRLEPSPGELDLRALADQLGLPLVQETVGDDHFSVLGRRLAPEPPLEAPDFELPDLSGQVHKLSEFRGRKVLLIAWAGW